MKPSTPTRRLLYVRREGLFVGQGLAEVIDGKMRFFQRDFEELQWYPFCPCAEERDEVWRLLAAQISTRQDQAPEIDVDELKKNRGGISGIAA